MFSDIYADVELVGQKKSKNMVTWYRDGPLRNPNFLQLSKYSAGRLSGREANTDNFFFRQKMSDICQLINTL